MHIYGLSTNYLQLKDKDQNKGATLCIYARTKDKGNIVEFINSAQPRYTLKQHNFIFEGHERNCFFLCAIKSIVPREELLINYNLNRIDTNVVTIGDVPLTI